MGAWDTNCLDARVQWLFMMSDFSWPQINGCEDIYITIILLCWWHVLHSWQKYFKIAAQPELWELLKRWIRITDADEFEATWVKIQALGKPDFILYLKKYWMTEKVKRMWSGMYRTERSLFEACDTNMLLEACVTISCRNPCPLLTSRR
ncbi:hypothetical protein C8R43DRAFT_1124721 [Mycena crocata]|nr:hypothetical protein C8R43DRAFT_1124721 [Mycena crocata]